VARLRQFVVMSELTLARALANPDAGRVVSKWLRVLPVVAVVVSFVGAVSGREEPTLVATLGAIVIHGLSVWFVFPATRLRQLSRFHAGSIVEVWLGESTPDGTTVHWRTREGHDAWALFPSVADARTIVERLDVASRRLRVVREFDARRIALATVWFVLVVALHVPFFEPPQVIHATGSGPGAMSMAMMLALGTAWPFATWLPPAAPVLIGADGVRVGRTFVPAGKIASVEAPHRWEIVVRTTDGATHRATIGQSLDARTAWVLDRIREVARASTTTVAALARAGRPFAVWRDDLERLVRGAYRTSTLSPELLRRVLDDDSAESDSRLGAGLALRSLESFTPALAARLLELSERTADPALATALRALAEDALTASVAERVGAGTSGAP
jgi:hypothetical protein